MAAIDDLLAPVPGPVPAGMDLAADGAGGKRLAKLRSLRDVIRSAERNAASADEFAASLTRWRDLEREAAGLLAGTSKDLGLATWVAEAWLRERGLPGLADGLRLIAGLVDGYWPDLYPAEDTEEEEAERPAARFAEVAKMLGGDGRLGGLSQPLMLMPLLGRDDPSLTLAAYDGTWAREKDAALREGRDPSPVVGEFARAATSLPLSRFEAALDGLDAVLGGCDRYDEAVAGKSLADVAPRTLALRDLVRRMRSVVRLVGGDRLAAGLTTADAPGAAPCPDSAGEGADGIPAPDAGAAGPAATPRPTAQGLQTREQAFTLLQQVARFFREREPHSPISYVLEEAVRRGRLPFPALMAELIEDETARRTLFQYAGMKAPAPE